MSLKKIAFSSLYLSIALLFPIFVIFVGSFQPLYYVLWVLGVGGYVYRNQSFLTEKFSGWRLPPFLKYVSIGIGVILLEETFASLAMHLMRYLREGSGITFFHDVSQFWAFNILALPGMIIAWYFLIKNYRYSKREIFVLAGMFGLFSEKILMHVVAYPLIGPLLIIPTMFTYALIIFIPLLSVDMSTGKPAGRALRYTLGLVAPLVFSMPFIAILMHLLLIAPHLFPPAGFVG